MTEPEVPDLRSNDLWSRLVTVGLWLKLLVGIGLVVSGGLALREDVGGGLLLAALGLAMSLPVVLWLRSESKGALD